MHEMAIQNIILSNLEQTNENTVDSRYLEVQGTILNTSRYPYLDISDLQNWKKKKKINKNK